ncbi:hypothetical protein ACNKHK_01660 [Shigella flexneri]
MGDWQGQQVLGMRLTWNKRYITLAPIATVLGLAFNSPTRKNCWVAKKIWHYLCADPNLNARRTNWASSLPAQRAVPERSDTRQRCVCTN